MATLLSPLSTLYRPARAPGRPSYPSYRIMIFLLIQTPWTQTTKKTTRVRRALRLHMSLRLVRGATTSKYILYYCMRASKFMRVRKKNGG